MKKAYMLVAAAAVSLSLAACTAQEQRAVEGGVLGAAAGAIIGGATTGRASGALAGAAIGGAGGAVVGAATAPQEPRCARIAYDYHGNPVCVEYY